MKEIEIYADGSCLNNPGKGGWCAYLKMSNSDYQRTICGNEYCTTNNRMELTAVIKALEQLKYPCKVSIYTDSMYVVNGFNKGWVDNWIKTDGNYGKIKNMDLWKRLYTLYNIHYVTFYHVAGHSGIVLNEYCDKIARQKAQQATPK